MSKKRGQTYYERMKLALKQLPTPLVDKRHNLFIYFADNRARSNQSRYEHIFVKRHRLTKHDIERIYKGLNNSILKKDKERTETYNLYIKRFNDVDYHYIKVSLHIDPHFPKIAYVKTVYITTIIK